MKTLITALVAFAALTAVVGPSQAGFGVVEVQTVDGPGL
jgi:hypothetical protein